MAGSLQMAAISLYMLTFNCGRSFIDTDAFASQLFSGLTSPKLPDLLVLSLQEIAPIPYSFIGGSFLVPYFTRFYHAVQKGARRWSNASDEVPIYIPVVVRNLGMTGIMVFAKDSSVIHDIETAGVGVGFWEMGNKGSVGVRCTYQGTGTSTELTFVAAHLAPMEDGLQRRNEDWKSIVQGLVFSSASTDRGGNATSLTGEERPLLSISSRDASIYKPTTNLFVAGDLNYRTSILSPSPIDYVDIFPQPHHDESSPQHFSTLFKSDQLSQERLAGRTLHGLSEAPVNFPPTYKYDAKGPFYTPDKELKQWHWARHRWPSWCDRILYLDVPSWVKRRNPDAKIVIGKYSALPLSSTSDHRAVTLEFSVPLIPFPSPSEEEEDNDPRIHPPFEINIDWKTRRERARLLELIIGFGMYFTTTWEGSGAITAMFVGSVGAYFAIRAMIEI